MHFFRGDYLSFCQEKISPGLNLLFPHSLNHCKNTFVLGVLYLVSVCLPERYYSFLGEHFWSENGYMFQYYKSEIDHFRCIKIQLGSEA